MDTHLHDRVNKTLRSLIEPDELDRLLRQSWSELEPDFLCFAEVYWAAALLVPAGATVVDFGCYMGFQAALFPHARYIGVDPTPMALPDGADSEHTHWLERFTPDWAEHHVATAQEFIEANRHWLGGPDVLAICSYVPDQAARAAVRAACWNVVDFYPMSADEHGARPLWGSTPVQLLDASNIARPSHTERA